MDATLSNSDRRYAQADAGESLRVAWIDEHGRFRCMPGRCIDVSARRIHIEVPGPVPLHTRVMLSTGRKCIPGPNAVKYVTQCDTKFIMVLE